MMPFKEACLIEGSIDTNNSKPAVKGVPLLLIYIGMSYIDKNGELDYTYNLDGSDNLPSLVEALFDAIKVLDKGAG